MAAEEPGLEPDYSCATCEYFDCGGENAMKDAILQRTRIEGDCLHRRSDRFQTWSDSLCPLWVRSSTLQDHSAEEAR